MSSAVNAQFQVSHATAYMRYQDYYSRIRAGLLNRENPRILVFGCSTGAELKTIHHFWPEAQVYGCDISEDVLEEAGRKAPFAEVFLSDEAAIRDRGPFDLVAANSVLCRHPFPKDDYADALPFAMFENYVNFLVSVLSSTGFLFIYNTNYFIDDLDISADLAPILVPEAWNGAFVPRVDTAGEVVAHPTVLDQVLRRFVLRRDIDPLARMRTALFARGAGPARMLTDRMALAPQSMPATDLVLPEPTHPMAFEPHFADTALREGTLRTTYLHNPLTSSWEVHGTHLIGMDTPNAR